MVEYLVIFLLAEDFLLAPFPEVLYRVCPYCGERQGVLRNRHTLCVPPEGFWVHEKLVSYVEEGCDPLALLDEMEGWGLSGGMVFGSIAVAVEVALETELGRVGFLSDERAESLKGYLGLIPGYSGRVSKYIRDARFLGQIMEGGVRDRDVSLLGIPGSEDLVYQAYGIGYSRPRWRRPPVWKAGILHSPRTYCSAGLQICDDRGTLAISTGGLYFRGGYREWSIPFNRLSAIDGYVDGIVVVGSTELAPGRPQVFYRAGLGWLVHNLVILLAKKGYQPVEAVGRQNMRDILVEHWGLRCWGCGLEFPHGGLLELDHNVPVSSGGSDDLSNRALLCSYCNKVKGNRLTLEGLRQLNKREGRWYGSPPIDQYIVLSVAAEWARNYVKRFGSS